MNIVISGGRLQVYGDDVITCKSIPTGTYEVAFHQMMGFYLTKHPDLDVKEDKVYGDHQRRIDKVFRTYEVTDRNLGVILSGTKGTGKSLLVRMMGQRAIEQDMPVILVNAAVPGIADFISSIEQEVLVIFDEFEKTFNATDDYDPQEELLNLFDGIDNGKKLFVVTCNELDKMNDYLLNRPGRFHYHFTIGSPSAEEIEEYMSDQLLPEYHDAIPRIANFACTVSMTYDFLRAIAFELNQGYSLEETLNDLNIMRTKSQRFNIVATFANGNVYTFFEHSMDIYSDKHETVRAWDHKGLPDTWFTFKPSDAIIENGRLVIPPEDIDHYVSEYEYDDELSEEEATAKRAEDNARVLESFVLNKIDESFIKRYLV